MTKKLSTKKVQNTKPLFNTTTTNHHTNTNNTETITKNKTMRRNTMITKTKTITQTVPSKPAVRRCFICSGPIAAPSVQKRTRKIKSSASCKSGLTSLCIPKTRKILGKEDLLKSPRNAAGNQNILPIARFKDTNTVLGY